NLALWASPHFGQRPVKGTAAESVSGTAPPNATFPTPLRGVGFGAGLLRQPFTRRF
ncbi:hypothetical protein JTE90_017853, partial [Oedothorax gibbosus]